MTDIGAEAVPNGAAGRVERAWIVIELAIFGALFWADAAGLIPLSKTPFLAAFIWIGLRLRRSGWRAIGLARPANFRRAVAFGIGIGIAIELFAQAVTTPLISSVFGAEPDLSGFREIVGNLPLLGLFLALNWTLAAFGEEICYRGFLMTRIAQLLGGSREAWAIALVLANVVFGAAHGYQGPSGWVQEGLSGLWLGLLYLGTGRNLVVPIVAHGVSNTLAFVLIYFGRYPGLS